MSEPPKPRPSGLDAAGQEFLAAQPSGAPKGPAAARKPAAGLRPAPAARPAQAPPRPKGPDQLLSAYDEVLAHEAAKRRLQREQRPLWRRILGPVLLVSLTAVAGWIWFGKPAWLYPPAPAPAPAARAPVARAFLRSAANLVEEYRGRTGRLPSTLADLNVPIPNLEFRARADGSYLIQTALGRHLFILEGTPEGVVEMREVVQ